MSGRDSIYPDARRHEYGEGKVVVAFTVRELSDLLERSPTRATCAKIIKAIDLLDPELAAHYRDCTE